MYSLCKRGGGPPPENFGKFRMQEKPSTTFIYHIFEAYSLYFYFSLISFLYFFLLFFKIFRLFFIFQALIIL